MEGQSAMLIDVREDHIDSISMLLNAIPGACLGNKIVDSKHHNPKESH